MKEAMNKMIAGFRQIHTIARSSCVFYSLMLHVMQSSPPIFPKKVMQPPYRVIWRQEPNRLALVVPLSFLSINLKNHSF